MPLVDSDLEKLVELLNKIDIRVQVRRKTAAEWTSTNEVLLDSEWGYEHDTGKIKIGDGATAWNALAYWGGGGQVATSAIDVTYDNAASSLVSGNVQDAIDELDENIISAGIDSISEVVVVAHADAVTTGSSKASWIAPFGGTIKEVFFGVSTAATSGATVSEMLNQSGQSIFSTKPSIEQTERTSLTGIPGAIDASKSTMSRGDLFTFGVNSVGTGAKGLRAVIRYGIEVLSSGWNLASAIYTGTQKSLEGTEYSGVTQGLFFSHDGTSMFVGRQKSSSEYGIFQFLLSTPWDASSAVYISGKYKDISQHVAGGNGFFIRKDGLMLYAISGVGSNVIKQFSMSTPFDITSLSYTGKSFAAIGTNSQNLRISEDGLSCIYSDYGNGYIRSFAMSVPWDISTSSISSVNAVSFNSCVGLEVKEDGKTIWICNYSSNVIVEYKMGIPFDILSASATGKTFSHSNQVTNNQAIFVNQDNGDKLYITGTGNVVYQYSVA